MIVYGLTTDKIIISLHDSGEAYMTIWPLFARYSEPFHTSMSFEKMCSLHIHELLHHAGLHDTYRMPADMKKRSEGDLCEEGMQRVEELDDVMNNAHNTL